MALSEQRMRHRNDGSDEASYSRTNGDPWITQQVFLRAHETKRAKVDSLQDLLCKDLQRDSMSRLSDAKLALSARALTFCRPDQSQR